MSKSVSEFVGRPAFLPHVLPNSLLGIMLRHVIVLLLRNGKPVQSKSSINPGASPKGPHLELPSHLLHMELLQ